MKFTKSRIEAIKPEKRECFVWDESIRGFGLRVSPKGKKSYFIQYRLHGKTNRIHLGSAEHILLSDAQKAASIILSDLAVGRNPALERQRLRKSPTMEKVVSRYLSEHVEPKLKKSTAEDYKRILNNHILPRFRTMKVKTITHKDIMSLHHAMRESPYRANCTVRVLSKIFNLCERWGYREHGSNPCRHIEKYKETSRQRFLTKEELQRLWHVLDHEEEMHTTSRYAISAYRLLILTGCRLGEIQKLKWSQVHGNRVEFRDTKTGYKRLPFNAEAMRILNAIPKRDCNPYIICGEKPGSHIVNLQKSWRRIREKAELTDVRIHDLRHTFASHAVMGGTPLAIVSKLLGHSKIGTTMRYAHLADKELMKASDAISSNLLSHSGNAD